MKRTSLRMIMGFAIAMVFLNAAPSFAQTTDEAIASGSTWLLGAQYGQGIWAFTTPPDPLQTEFTPEDYTKTYARDTFEAVRALQATGVDPAEYESALYWAEDFKVPISAYIAKKVTIVSAEGKDASEHIQDILSLQNSDGGFGGAKGFASSALTTAQILLALNDAGYTDNTVSSAAISYLSSAQNSDGGWGVYAGDGDSSTIVTAQVLRAIKPYAYSTTQVATAVNKAVTYLLAHRNSDGGFGSSPSTVYATAMAYMALDGVSTDATVLGGAIEYLKNAQHADGSWEDDPYQTALALQAFTTGEDTTASTGSTTGTISGTIVDAASNSPLSGVFVALVSDPAVSTTTLADGSFELTGLEAGTVTLEFSAAGYSSATMELSASASGVLDVGTVTLAVNPTTGIISGVVKDKATGAVLEGAMVSLSGSYTVETITGDDGSYVITDVTPGTVTITASADGYYSASGTGTVSAGGTLGFSPSLSIEPSSVTVCTLSGTVVSSSGQAISGAAISLTGWGNATSNDSGHFEIADLEFGTYVVTIAASGYVSQSSNILLADYFDMGIVRMNPVLTSSSVSGTVTDADTGLPVAGAMVKVVEAGLSVTAGSDGAYVIEGVELPEFTLKASATGYNSSSYAVRASGYGEFSADFALDVYEVSAISIESISIDKDVYRIHEYAIITATILNKGTADADVFLMAEVIGSAGEVVSIAYAEGNSTVTADGEAAITLAWNTGQFSPSEYTIVVKALETAGIETGSGDTYSTTQAVLAEKTGTMTIAAVSQVEAYLKVDPPATIADFNTPIKITAAARNSGNVSVDTMARVEVGHGGLVDYSAEVPIEGLDVNGVLEMDFGSFTPSEGGEYTVTLSSTDSSISLSASASLYVGVHASATFKVSPETSVAGDISVRGTITVTGEGLQNAKVEDPLVLLVKGALQNSVNWTQTYAVSWQNQNNCFGCHVQSQALIGLELSRDKVTVSDWISALLLDYMKDCQVTSGYLSWWPGLWSGAAPVETTTLFIWAASYYHDSDAVNESLVKALDFILPYQSSSGYWVDDYYEGSWKWWSDLGQNKPSTPFTAYNIIGFAKGYQLTGRESYKASIVKAANYLTYMDYDQSIITAAHVVIGLEAALPYIEDASLLSAAEARIDEAVAYLRSTQNADGGWARYYGNASDPLPTAHALYAIGRTVSNGTDDMTLRSGATYLLNNQNSNGSWSTTFVRSDKYPDEHFGVTTWATISLPVTLGAISGISGTLSVTVPSDIAIESASPSASKKVVSGDVATYSWELTGLNADGTNVDLEMTVHGLAIGEVRPVADSATLAFVNEYTDELRTVALDIPTVTGIDGEPMDGVSMEATTDKATYVVNDDVHIKTIIRNSLIAPRDATVHIAIQDEEGNTVTTVASDTLRLAANVLADWAYRIPISLLTDHDAMDIVAQATVDMRSVHEQLGMAYAGVDENSFRVLEFDESGVYLGERKQKTEFVSDDEVKVRFLADGQTYAGLPRQFYIYFDIPINGPKAPSTMGDYSAQEQYILLSDGSGKLSYLVHNEDGSFSQPADLMDVSPSYDYTYNFGVGDLNNDGAFDIVAGTRATQTAYAFIQNATTFGEFEPVTLGAYEGTTVFADAEVEDLNNDGFLDAIYVGYYSDWMPIAYGRGDGTFDPFIHWEYFGTTVYGLDAGDVNSDGISDLVIGSKGIYMKTGRAGGTYNSRSTIYSIWDTFLDIEIADINGDGRNDILAVKMTRQGSRYLFPLYVLFGDGMGGFGSPILLEQVETAYQVETADLNDDGNVDILAANDSRRTLDLYLGNGDGTFGQRIEVADTLSITGVKYFGGAVIHSVAVGIPEYLPVTHEVVWNTGSLLAGLYYAHVSVSTDNGVTDEELLPFTIVPDTSVVSQVAVDQLSYEPGDTVAVKTRVVGESRNAMLEGLTTTTVIEGPSGETVSSVEGTIALLAPGQLVDQSAYWQTTGAAPGVYTVRFTVLDGSELLATAQATFEVLGTAATGEGLTGTIALDESRLSPGEDAAFTATITNAGNEDVTGATVSVLLIDPISGTVLQTQEGAQDLMTGVTVTVSGTLGTTGLTMNEAYLVVLRVATAAMSEAKTLASATLEVVDTTPPVATLTAPASGSLWNGPVAIAATATDDASGVNSVEYRIDSGAWAAMSASGAGYAATWTPTSSNEGARTISVRATDNAGNASEPVSVSVTIDLTPPSPPVITSPAEGSVLVVRDLTIEGTAEVGAWVTLTGPSLTTTIMNDGFEDFAFEGIALDPGENMFRFTATDAVGNVSEEAVLTISYVPIEMSIEMPADLTNVLLWINTGCTSSAEKGCANLDTVLAVAEELFTGARIVYDKKEFQAELGNPYYTDFVILGDHDPLEDHYASLLRERVYAGAGLVSSLFTPEKLNESALAIKQAGRLAGSGFTLALGGEAPAWQGEYAITGDALKMDSEGATGAGWFAMVSKKGEVEYAPAVMANEYGIGRAMVFAFATEEQSAETMRDLLGQAVGYVHRTPAEGEAQPSSGMTAIRASLTTEGGEIGVRYTLEFPEGLALYDALAGAWVEESPYTLDATIEKDAPAEAVLYVLTPEAGGTYTVTSSVGYVEGDTYTEVATDERDVTVVDRATLLGWALDGLSTLAVSTDEIDWVAEAVATLDGVRLRGDATPEARDEDARDVLHAVEMTRKVTSADTSNALLLMDALLRSYAGAEYYGR